MIIILNLFRDILKRLISLQKLPARSTCAEATISK